MLNVNNWPKIDFGNKTFILKKKKTWKMILKRFRVSNHLVHVVFYIKVYVDHISGRCTT